MTKAELSPLTKERIGLGLQRAWENPLSSYHTKYEGQQGERLKTAISYRMKMWWQRLTNDERREFLKRRGQKISAAKRVKKKN